MTDTVLARLAEIKTMATPDLKTSWRELFATEPPPYNRKFLESRLAYRIQELAYGGLKPETLRRLAALADDLEVGKSAGIRNRNEDRPIVGTRLMREWKGVEHCATVTADAPYRNVAAVELLAQCLQPFDRLRLQSAIGEFLDAVGEPALQEAPVVARRLTLKQRAPLCLQRQHRRQLEFRQLRQNGIGHAPASAVSGDA